MATFMQEGEFIDYTPGTAVAAGDVILSQTQVFIAPRAIAANALGSLATGGIWKVAKATGATWSIGEKLYWDSSESNFTPTSTDNTLAGYATAAAASGDTVGYLHLNGAA